MVLHAVRSHSTPPCLAAVFAASTAAVLHEADAPDNAKYLPSGVIFHGAGDFIWKDVAGSTHTTVVPASAAGLFVPIAPAELTSSNAVAVTVFWTTGR